MTPILNEILQLQRGISTAAAELLLTRMLAKAMTFVERERLNVEQGGLKGRVLGGRSWRCANNGIGTTGQIARLDGPSAGGRPP
jgi:hypothetical protein